jgi:hypothetical protein
MSDARATLCLWCPAPLPATSNRGSPRRFCSDVTGGMEHLRVEELQADIDAMKAKRDSAAKN